MTQEDQHVAHEAKVDRCGVVDVQLISHFRRFWRMSMGECKSICTAVQTIHLALRGGFEGEEDVGEFVKVHGGEERPRFLVRLVVALLCVPSLQFVLICTGLVVLVLVGEEVDAVGEGAGGEEGELNAP